MPHSSQSSFPPLADMSDSRVIAFLPRHATSWAKMVELAQLIVDDGRFEPVMLLTTQAMAALAPTAGRLGLDYLDISAEVTAALDRASAPWTNRYDWGSSGAKVSPNLPSALLKAHRMSRTLAAWQSAVGQALESLRPMVMMMPGDRELAPVAPTLLACRERSIPTVICTSNVPSVEALRKSRENDPAFTCNGSAPLLNRLAAWLYAGQINMADGKPMLFSPGWRILALARRGMISANPWVQGGGLADHVLHHNKSRLEFAVDLGFDPEKAVFVGDHTVDPLFHAYQARKEIRAAIYEEFELSSERRLIIVSMPNDAEHGLCDMATHLARLDNWMQPIYEAGHHVVISLHPKSARVDYHAMADRYGFHFATHKLSEILPAADLFVCSCSSTIFWAQLCSVPVINMDYMRYRSPHFSAPVGVLTAETPGQMALCLHNFASGKADDGLADYAKKLRADSLFDGRAGRRICDFLEERSG